MSHDEEFYTDARSLKTAVRLAINRFRRMRKRIKGWKMEHAKEKNPGKELQEWIDGGAPPKKLAEYEAKLDRVKNIRKIRKQRKFLEKKLPRGVVGKMSSKAKANYAKEALAQRRRRRIGVGATVGALGTIVGGTAIAGKLDRRKTIRKMREKYGEPKATMGGKKGWWVTVKGGRRLFIATTGQGLNTSWKKGGEIGWNKSSLMNVSDQGIGRVKVERLDKIQGQDTVGGKLMIIRRKVRRRRKKETI